MESIMALLQREEVLTVADFKAACPGMPMASVYSRIRSLLLDGKLSTVGRGQYQAIHKPVYEVPVTDWMKEVNRYLNDTCIGVDHCIMQKEGNLYIEAGKADLPEVFQRLQDRYHKVVMQKDAARFPAALEGYIIVGALISDSPVYHFQEITVPSLEKKLVDSLIQKEAGPQDVFAFQKALEIYPVNMNRLRRYASRRGVGEELSARLSSLDQGRIALFSTTQKYLATIPVVKAWVFGSFARGEETPSSDLDLLVDYDPSIQLSLLDIIRFKLNLEKRIGREVDLIENGSLKPFALPSAERDKYLIYER